MSTAAAAANFNTQRDIALFATVMHNQPSSLTRHQSLPASRIRIRKVGSHSISQKRMPN
jgi:hypothetical protein